MHELSHIVVGHQGSYLEDLGNLEANDDESEADQLAANWLIDPIVLQSFVAQYQPRFARKAIERFAESQKRHPELF